jgi:hypothetical protein
VSAQSLVSLRVNSQLFPLLSFQRLGALCDTGSRGLRSPTVCYPRTASALELFPTHHTTRGRACLLPFSLAIMRFVHAMWRCDMPLAEYLQAWEGGHSLLCFALPVLCLLSSHFQVKPTHSLHTTADKLSTHAYTLPCPMGGASGSYDAVDTIDVQAPCWVAARQCRGYSR